MDAIETELSATVPKSRETYSLSSTLFALVDVVLHTAWLWARLTGHTVRVPLSTSRLRRAR
eukprot:1577262-Lingulodinium_polyedra.AAC.1